MARTQVLGLLEQLMKTDKSCPSAHSRLLSPPREGTAKLCPSFGRGAKTIQMASFM